MAIKYCPECGGEYQEWAKRCADCKVALVDTKPEIKRKGNPDIIEKGDRRYIKEPLVAIASFATTMEALFSKGVLESEGIPSIITDADSVLLNGKNTSTVHGVSLAVRESNAAAAREILDSIQKNISEEDFPEGEFTAGEIPDEGGPG